MGQQQSWQGYKHQLDADKKNQVHKVPDSEEKGTTCIYRHPNAKNGFGMFLKINPEEKSEELNTGWLCFKQSAVTNGNEKCFGYRAFIDPNDLSKRSEYIWDTYKTVLDDVLKVGNGIATLGLSPKCTIGLYALNRPEWMTCHLAGWSQGFTTTALYDTLGAEAVQYIIWHSEMEIIFVAKAQIEELFNGLELVLQSENKENLKLKFIVQFDKQKKFNNLHEEVEEKYRDKAREMGFQLFGLTEIMEKAAGKTEENPPSSDDLAYIMYTSGTTGPPKGVMLTQKAFACVVGSTIRGIAVHESKFGVGDRHVSYLPLAHSFESSILMCLLSVGASVAFFQGNIKKISDDWKAIRPTIMVGVPRIYSKTFDKIVAGADAAGGLKKSMFNSALSSSSVSIRQGKRSGLYDFLVWGGIAEKVGFDKVRFMVSGAAPLPPHVAEFLRIVCAKGVVSQGYGLTESLAVSFFTQFNDLTLGHIGIPVDNIEFRLVDAPECNYFTTDEPLPRGEIQLRGPTIMQGYFKNIEKTKDCLDDDGWFSTGDIGRVNYNGTLSIIDRRKNMFKTASGEYIAAEKLETVYGQADGIGQMWIYGNSFKEFVVAVVVPDALHMVVQYTAQGWWSDDDSKLTPATEEYNKRFKEVSEAHREFVKTYILKSLKAVEGKNDIKKFEKVKDIALELEIDELLQGFNGKNGTLTPTFKLKRPILKQRYLPVLKELYSTNGAPPKDTEDWDA